MRHLTAVLLALMLSVAACGEDDDGGGSGRSTLEPNEARIAEKDIPHDEWPLTVPRGVVRCEGAADVFFQAPDGTEYAVNGAAKTTRRDLPEIERIWDKTGGRFGGTTLSVVIDKGLKLCGR